MNVLLDTHAFLWIAHAPDNLSIEALTAIERASVRWLSMVTIWELQIKIASGKMTMTGDLSAFVKEESQLNDFIILPIVQDHIYRLANLPHHHRNPFDRLLIAQTQHEGLTLITKDAVIHRYAVQTVW